MIEVMPGIQLVEGITYQTIEQGRIRVYSVQTLHRRALDTCFEHAVTGLADCPPDTIYRVLYDLSDISLFALLSTGAYAIGSLGMTAVGQARVREILAGDTQRRARLAILTHPTLSARVMKKLSTAERYAASKFFFSLERALGWLNQEEETYG